MAAFGRHPATSKLVWSNNIGYPADYNYREYYRDIGFDLDQDYLEPFQYAHGIRTTRASSTTASPGRAQDKHLYNPDWGRRRPRSTPRDFANRCRDQACAAGSRMPFPAVMVSPYDAELFGHWWFEGPQWIYYVMRELADGGDLALGTPGEYLERTRSSRRRCRRRAAGAATATTSTGSTPRPTGCGGRCTRRRCGCARRCSSHRPHAGSLEDRALRQAGRELMLAQSSDWPFIITNGTTEDTPAAVSTTTSTAFTTC